MLFRSFKDFDVRDEASLINWLAKIAERQILATTVHHGAQKRDRNREVPLLDMVESCVSELPAKYREVILLHDYAGASWETVALETGSTSPSAARMLHGRALVELGKLLRQKGIE